MPFVSLQERQLAERQQKLLGTDYVLLSPTAIPKHWEYLGVEEVTI